MDNYLQLRKVSYAFTMTSWFSYIQKNELEQQKGFPKLLFCFFKGKTTHVCLSRTAKNWPLQWNYSQKFFDNNTYERDNNLLYTFTD